MTPGLGIELKPHWWEASALTNAPTLLPICAVMLSMRTSVDCLFLRVERLQERFGKHDKYTWSMKAFGGGGEGTMEITNRVGTIEGGIRIVYIFRYLTFVIRVHLNGLCAWTHTKKLGHEASSPLFPLTVLIIRWFSPFLLKKSDVFQHWIKGPNYFCPGL